MRSANETSSNEPPQGQHLSAERLDALAYDMLEARLLAEAAAHVAVCEACSRRLDVRTAEASILEEALAAPAGGRTPAWLRWSAAALVLLAVGSFVGLDRRATTPRVDVPVRAGLGALHELADGTLVHASAAVEILGWREVAVGPGDYFFSVVARPDMPFLVRTPAGLVRVVGTKFRLFVEDPKMNPKSIALVAVAVISGVVIVSNMQGTVDVGPGQEVVMEEGAAPERVGENPSLRPVFVRPSPQERMARLESELKDARRQIEALQAGSEQAGAEDGVDAASPEALATAQGRFFDLRAARREGRASEDEVAELLALSKNKKLMGFIVQDLQKKIEADPDDLEARLDLANVESSRVHIAESITERAMFGRNTREQITEILKRDPENWDARYMRAVGISHSQRTPQGRADAIRAFESLLSLQGSRPDNPRFAQTYSQLAIVYMAERDREKARETVRAGLAAYPETKDLVGLLKRLTEREE